MCVGTAVVIRIGATVGAKSGRTVGSLVTLGRVGVGVVGAGVGGLGEAVGVGAVGAGVGGGGSIWTCVVVLGMHLTYSDMC